MNEIFCFKSNNCTLPRGCVVPTTTLVSSSYLVPCVSSGEEDIPEIIEAVDDNEETPRQAFTNMLNRPPMNVPKPLTGGMNLPGSAWLQSRRAQVR